MASHCTRCGAEVAAGDRFCSGCGHAVASSNAVSAGERRQVTVLFADMVGSAALGEQWDPEKYQGLIKQYHHACGEVAQRYGGHVAHYLGDGVVMFFGYPVAHEDDAIRAVRTGLDTIQRVRDLRVDEQHLQLRMAIHTGLVVVDDAGGQEPGERSVLGTVPNIAARLQSRADPDTVLISEATRGLVAGHFDLEDLGALALKGIQKPVRAFRVIGDADVTSRFEAAAGAGLTPMTGREKEIEVIGGLWAGAIRGEGGALLLCGDAGIGKSRLLGLAREAALADGCEVIAAQCSPYHTNSAFHPVADVFERRLGLIPRRSPEEEISVLEGYLAGFELALDRAVPLLAPLLSIRMGDRYAPSDLSPTRRRQETLALLTHLLLRISGDRPALILVEDLHWADPSTLDLLGMFIEREGAVPGLVALTTRQSPSELPAIAAHSTILEIAPLPDTDTRTLIARVVGERRLPESVIHEIIARTAGVPLFVEAVTRTILESGVLRERDGRYELDRPLPAQLIPPTVHDSLMARIDALGEGRARSLIQLAATVGREFTFDLLQSVSGCDRDELSEALERMVELNLLARMRTLSSDTYSFTHALIQDAAYDSLLTTTRRQHHGAISKVLLERFPEMRETAPEVLARHFEGAGDIESAIDHWMAAGVRAQQQSAERECASYLQKAIRLLEMFPSDDADRMGKELSAQLALAPALMATCGWGAIEVEMACVRARELCERTANGMGLVAALWGLWTVQFVRAELDSAVETAESVLKMARASGDPVLLVAACHGLGFTHYFRGEFAAARECAEEGLVGFSLERERLLVSLFQIPSSVCCLAVLAQCLRLTGYPEMARRRHQEMDELVEALARPECTVVGLGIGMWYDFDLRDVETIERKAVAGHKLATDEGFQFWAPAMQICYGWAQCIHGNSELGHAEILTGMADFRHTGSALMLPTFHLMLAEGLRSDGQLTPALEKLQTSKRLVEERNERYYEAEIHRIEGEILTATGATAEGEACLRHAIEVARSQGARLLELRAAVALARLMVAQRRLPEVQPLLRPLCDWFTEGSGTLEMKEAEWLLGLSNGEPRT